MMKWLDFDKDDKMDSVFALVMQLCVVAASVLGVIALWKWVF